MPDPIANFSLRGATLEDLGVSLGRCYREYSLWHGQAALVASFAQDAQIAGVRAVLADRVRGSVAFAQAEGIIKVESQVSDTLFGEIVDHQLGIADHGLKIAAVVMLHNACERFLWRLVRFGLIGNRPKAISWIAEKKVTVKMLGEHLPEVLIDDQLEKWWDDLERDKLTNKWQRLAGLVGYPAKFTVETWHFDLEMLSRFDEIRHNAVHHDGQPVKSFDFAEFASQLSRAQLVWLVHVGRLLKLRIPAEAMFLGRSCPPAGLGGQFLSIELLSRAMCIWNRTHYRLKGCAQRLGTAKGSNAWATAIGV